MGSLPLGRKLFKTKVLRVVEEEFHNILIKG